MRGRYNYLRSRTAPSIKNRGGTDANFKRFAQTTKTSIAPGEKTIFKYCPVCGCEALKVQPAENGRVYMRCDCSKGEIAISYL